MGLQTNLWLVQLAFFNGVPSLGPPGAVGRCPVCRSSAAWASTCPPSAAFRTPQVMGFKMAREVDGKCSTQINMFDSWHLMFWFHMLSLDPCLWKFISLGKRNYGIDLDPGFGVWTWIYSDNSDIHGFTFNTRAAADLKETMLWLEDTGKIFFSK